MMKRILSLFFIIFSLSCNAAAKNLDNSIIELTLVIKNHRFIPDILEIPRDRKIRLTVENQDQTIEEFESIDLKREKIIPGNSNAKVILAPLQPGKYKFYGEFHEDTAQGVIIVKED